MNTPQKSLNLNFTFDYGDFSAYLARDEKNKEKTEERLGVFYTVIDFFKGKYGYDNKEAFKYLKKKLERAKKQQFIHHQEREVIVNVLADWTKPYSDADDSEQKIFPPLRDELINNYLWYCKRAKNAHRKGIIEPTKKKLKQTLESKEEDNQEILDEIRTLEEQFNEWDGKDYELWRRIAELKSLL